MSKTEPKKHACANCSSTFTHEPMLKCCSFKCASLLKYGHRPVQKYWDHTAQDWRVDEPGSLWKDYCDLVDREWRDLLKDGWWQDTEDEEES